MATVFMRTSLWQNLVSEPAPKPSCMAWRLVTESGSTNSSQAIMRWMYSWNSTVGASISMVPWIHSVPRCR